MSVHQLPSSRPPIGSVSDDDFKMEEGVAGSLAQRINKQEQQISSWCSVIDTGAWQNRITGLYSTGENISCWESLEGCTARTIQTYELYIKVSHFQQGKLVPVILHIKPPENSFITFFVLWRNQLSRFTLHPLPHKSNTAYQVHFLLSRNEKQAPLILPGGLERLPGDYNGFFLAAQNNTQIEAVPIPLPFPHISPSLLGNSFLIENRPGKIKPARLFLQWIKPSFDQIAKNFQTVQQLSKWCSTIKGGRKWSQELSQAKSTAQKVEHIRNCWDFLKTLAKESIQAYKFGIYTNYCLPSGEIDLRLQTWQAEEGVPESIFVLHQGTLRYVNLLPLPENPEEPLLGVIIQKNPDQEVCKATEEQLEAWAGNLNGYFFMADREQGEYIEAAVVPHS